MRGLVALVLGGACAPEVEVTPRQYIDYGHAPELQPCGGNAAYVDSFAQHVAAVLGFESFGHASFSWVAPGELGRGRLRSCKGAVGCSIEDTAYSQWPVHLHEATHALLDSFNDDPNPFLREGIAAALDIPNGLTVNTLKANGISAADLRTELAKQEGFDYDKAGLFVLYLLQSFGADKFRELYRRGHPGMDLAAFDALMLETYGVGVDEATAALLGDSGCPVGVTPVPWYECEAPMLAAQDGGWMFERTLDCAETDVVGGLETDWGIVAGATFDVELPGFYEIAFEAPTTALVHVAACAHCRWLSAQVVASEDSTTVVFLADGKHFVTTRLFGRDQGGVHVRISPAQ